MSNLAAEFIDKVANSSITDARKKLPTLTWGKGNLLEFTDYDETGNPTKPCSCAIGIGELAACNKPDSIENVFFLDDIKKSSLGKRGARATMKLEQCPFTIRGNHSKKQIPCEKKFVEYGETTLPAEGIVTHINDTHATSWPECKKMLKQIAKLERKAVAKAKKHVA